MAEDSESGEGFPTGEESLLEDRLLDASFTALIDVFMRYCLLYGVYEFWRRFQRRRHPVTIIGLCGVSIALFRHFLKFILIVFEEMFRDVCKSRVEVLLWIILRPISYALGFIHLLLKARLVHFGTARRWIVLHIFSAISILLLFISASMHMVVIEAVFPKHPAFNCSYTVRRSYEFFDAAIVITNNIVATSIFLTGMIDIFTGGVDMGFHIRLKSVWALLIYGVPGLKKLPRHSTLFNGCALSVHGIETRASERSRQEIRVMIARKNFIALLASTIFTLTVSIINLSVTSAMWTYSLYNADLAISWAFTVWVCPTPEEEGKSRIPLASSWVESRVDGAVTGTELEDFSGTRWAYKPIT